MLQFHCITLYSDKIIKLYFSHKTLYWKKYFCFLQGAYHSVIRKETEQEFLMTSNKTCQ